jgi:hypothetical protein
VCACECVCVCRECHHRNTTAKASSTPPTSYEDCTKQMFGNIFMAAIYDISAGGLCEFFYETIAMANDNYLRSTMFSPQMLSESQLLSFLDNRVKEVVFSSRSLFESVYLVTYRCRSDSHDKK